jgi:hypothetical protein
VADSRQERLSGLVCRSPFPLAVFGMLVANINQISASEAFPWSKVDDDAHDVHGSGMMRIAVYAVSE